MEIRKKATAGTLESSDIFVQVEPNDNGLVIKLESIVMNQFGEAIENTVKEVLKSFNVQNIIIQLKDRGAVECAIRARIETALKRAEGMDN